VKFTKFLEIGEYTICIIDLGGWTSLFVPGYGTITRSHSR